MKDETTVKTTKGKFVLGTRTYRWLATINGRIGYGMTKKEAIKDVQTGASK